MTDKHLHIISFIVPFPVNYGGVFDIFHKIVALHKAGVKIHLHSFTENNREQPELNKYCHRIHYYPRKKGPAGTSFTLPYIVSSRIDKNLWRRLDEDDYPVLIEGIHSAGWLINENRRKRKVILRLHNVEHDYYQQLFVSTSSALKKMYFHFEAFLLKKFEQRISRLPDYILAVSADDAKKYKDEFGVVNIEVLPVFTGFSNDTPPSGTGNFCLYHGNLSISENEKAVAWLLKEVFSSLHVPFVVAGKQPSPALKQFISKFEIAQLIADPSTEQMQSLVSSAQCHVLPSFNNTGVKLKLINALFHGRHCIVNPAAVRGSGLEEVCHIARSPEQFKESTEMLFNRPLTGEEIRSRKKVLKELFDEEKNCATLSRRIW